MRLLTIFVGIGIALLLEKHIGDLGLTVGWLMSLFIFGIIMIGLERMYPYLEKLDDYTKTYKRYPYTEMYGRNYPQPKPDDFGISQEEFKEYNGRFQFEFTKLIFTYGLLIAASAYLLQGNVMGSPAIFLIGAAAVSAILMNYLFDYWNKRISQRHRYYEKIHEYQEALSIYYKIRDENSTI